MCIRDRAYPRRARSPGGQEPLGRAYPRRARSPGGQERPRRRCPRRARSPGGQDRPRRRCPRRARSPGGQERPRRRCPRRARSPHDRLVRQDDRDVSATSRGRSSPGSLLEADGTCRRGSERAPPDPDPVGFGLDRDGGQVRPICPRGVPRATADRIGVRVDDRGRRLVEAMSQRPWDQLLGTVSSLTRSTMKCESPNTCSGVCSAK